MQGQGLSMESYSVLSRSQNDSPVEFPNEHPTTPDPTASSPSHSTHQSIVHVTRERMAKKIRFFRNGDRFYPGLVFAVSKERYPTLDSLMADLTASSVCDRRVLSKGVRYIFTLDGTRMITDLSQLEAGCGYVCSSTPTYRRANYPKTGFPSWNMNHGSGFHSRSCHLSSRNTYSSMHLASHAQSSMTSSAGQEMDGKRRFVHPRLVVVIRKGRKPRKCYRLLLNRKTAHSLSQVFADVTKMVKPDIGGIRKIYSISGKKVTQLRDFFGDDNVFLAYSNERPSAEDFELCDKELQQLSFNRAAVSQMTSSSCSSRTGARTPNRMGSMTSARSLALRGSGGDVGGGGRRLPLNYSSQSNRLNIPSAVVRPSTIKPQVERRIDSRLLRVRSQEPKQLRVKYRIGHVIGEGYFAIVKECTEKARKLPFALKIVNKRKCEGRERMINNEVSILRRIKHPNIVQLIDEFDTSEYLYLVMELVTGGDLLDSIASATKYSERDASGMLFHLANAVFYLHSLNIVHRDIKLENLLVHERGDGFKSLKLGDFGLATEVREPLFTMCGTPTYIAPEILAETGYGLKVDIWSVGVILYILLCGFPPFSSETNDTDELFDKIQSGRFEFLDHYWQNISEPAKRLIVHLLEVDVEKRFSAEELLTYPWVAEDIAKDNIIHPSVASRLVQFAKSERIIGEEEEEEEEEDEEHPTESRVAIIATTALDKGDSYFPRRNSLQLKNRQNGAENC